MDQATILSYVKNHPSGKVKIAYSDIDGILRGKYISTDKFFSCVENKTSFCDVIYGWDSNDVCYDNTAYTGWHTGYPDTPSTIDMHSFRRIPWEDNIPFFLGELLNKEGGPADVCGRQLLKKIIGKAQSMGLNAVCAQEFEWFNFSETPQTVQDKNYKNLTPITPGMFGYSILRTSLKNDFFSSLFDLLGKFNIPIEGLHTETGAGTYEAAINYSGALEAADRAVLFKTAVKEIAYKHNIMATFMAKVNENLPGCGGHIHQSLWDLESGTNLFYDRKESTNMSELMQQYIAGQLYCLPHILPFFAPTINSYKRLVEGAWAPTTLTWGIDNRTVAIRVLNSSSKSCRVETRVPGADVNPYLSIAASIGAGLFGIENKLTLQPITTGNGYKEEKYGRLPTTLAMATAKMKQAGLATEIFGDGFTDHFTATREWEWRQHLKPVTDWELKRYFEII
jgi:glutamine synthetase